MRNPTPSQCPVFPDARRPFRDWARVLGFGIGDGGASRSESIRLASRSFRKSTRCLRRFGTARHPSYTRVAEFPPPPIRVSVSGRRQRIFYKRLDLAVREPSALASLSREIHCQGVVLAHCGTVATNLHLCALSARFAITVNPVFGVRRRPRACSDHRGESENR